MEFLIVGLGGALGAAGRYGISLLPVKGSFPWLTLLTNLIGAIAIGAIACAASRGKINAPGTLFWKTGVCGGFTTFSTFSLETWQLFEQGKMISGLLYAGCSVVLCIFGVWCGWRLAQVSG